MGVFTRFKDIVGANINSLLDKAENPEKMIKMMIQEMEDTLIELKSACAEKMAAKAKTKRQYDELKGRADRWQQRAVLAVERGRDDLAREALLEKRGCEADMEVLDGDLNQYDTLIAECRENILQIEEKLQSVRQKHKLLIQRGIHAKEQIRARQTISQAEDLQAYHRFSELEQRIERMEADAEMAGFSAVKSNLEQEFHHMESSGVVDEELEQLKRSLSSSKSTEQQTKKK